jgi:hypothetical protein
MVANCSIYNECKNELIFISKVAAWLSLNGTRGAAAT